MITRLWIFLRVMMLFPGRLHFVSAASPQIRGGFAKEASPLLRKGDHASLRASVSRQRRLIRHSASSSERTLHPSLPPHGRKLSRSVAPPLPTGPASLGSGGNPEGYLHRRRRRGIFTCPAGRPRQAAPSLPGTPGWRRRRWRCGSSCRHSPAAPQPRRCRRRR